jgi:hypothetical protein
MRLNVLYGVEIRGIWGVLMTPHFELLSDRNANLFIHRSVVFYDNWLFHISE